MVDFLKRESLAYENIYKLELRMMGLNFTGRFILKKLKKIIDMDQDESPSKFHSGLKNGPEMRSKKKLNIPKAMKLKLTEQLYKRLQKASAGFSQLWQVVSEDNLGMGKVYLVVKRANKSIQKCLEYWKKLELF